MIIAVDFDGTIVKHEYPKIGEPIPGALEWIKRWGKAGAKIILWTMRSGIYLTEAVEYLENNGITLYGVNDNPHQRYWTSSPKAYANLYVDDAAYGCPLSKNGSERPYVNWDVIGQPILDRIVIERG